MLKLILPWFVVTLCLSLLSQPGLALDSLNDDELSSVDGAGLGLVLDNYDLSVDNASSWKVGVDGTIAELVFEQFWWSPANGATATPAASGACAAGTSPYTSVLPGLSGCRAETISGRPLGGSATLGRVRDPIRFDVENRTTNFDGSGRATRLANGSIGGRTTMTLAAPRTTASTDLMDASFLMTLDHGTNVASSYRYDMTRVTTRDMDIDGSYISLWSEPGEGLSYIGQINVRASSVNFVTNEYGSKPALSTSPSAGDSFGFEVQPRTAYSNFRLGGCLSAAACDNNSTLINSRGVEFFYPMGRAFYQPIQIKTNADGNFTIELKNSIGNASSLWEDFYSSATPRGYIRIGSITTNWDGIAPLTFDSSGGTPANSTANRWERYVYDSYACGFLWLSTCYRHDYRPLNNHPRIDFGYSRIEGIQIQRLRVTTKNL